MKAQPRFTRYLSIALASLGLLAASSAPQAQDFSGKPIRIIVGLSAGGATDVMARLVAAKMSEALNTPVTVENKTGGNFIPALRELTSSKPDGHTLFFISTSSLLTQPLHPDYPFDHRKLTPITQVATGPLILVARNGLGVKNVRELIAYAEKQPGKLNFAAGGGTGGAFYFATELLKARTGMKVNVINYRGGAPALNDLLGNHVDAMFDAMPIMAAQAKESKVTPLAITGKTRSPVLPDVPTMMESGVRDYEIYAWFGMLAPEGTPPEVAQRLRDAVAKTVTAPDVAAMLDSQGMVPLATQPREWAKVVHSELEMYTRIVKEANIKP